MSGDPYKTGCNYVDPIRGKTECTTNLDCASNLICDQGSCISACTNLLCGPNAFCEPENHAGWCRCKVGFVEGQNGECVSRKYFTVLMRFNKTISVNEKLKKINKSLCLNMVINLQNLIDNVSHTCYSHIHKNLINTN